MQRNFRRYYLLHWPRQLYRQGPKLNETQYSLVADIRFPNEICLVSLQTVVKGLRLFQVLGLTHRGLWLLERWRLETPRDPTTHARNFWLSTKVSLETSWL